MKKTIIVVTLCLLAAVICKAQDSAASININWAYYAADTSRTYAQIVTLCDSLYALAGYGSETDTNGHDGDAFWKYNVWKSFWSSRWDVATGKLHDFSADALSVLNNQSKTTSAPTNCAGTSPLQSSLPSVPTGWQFIGPQGITSSGHNQRLGEVWKIFVNPGDQSEIYIADVWGGLWKTTNADEAPNNTWTCISDNLPQLSGIGIIDLYVDFAVSPHRIFCLAGVPSQFCMPKITDGNPRTVGVFYSTNGGASFNQMNVSGFLSNIAEDPILCMRYWPYNSAGITTQKYIFLGTKYHLFRVDITNPAAVSATTMVDMHSKLPSSPTDNSIKRFKGFSEIAFSADVSDPFPMYVGTKLNLDIPEVPSMYRIANCTCSTCPLINIPSTSSDFLDSRGAFSGITPFPEKNKLWTKAPEWIRDVTYDYAKCTPPITGAASIEFPVGGSYLHDITYTISFDLTLPAYTEVDVVLKDVEIGRWENETDWGTGVTPANAGHAGYYDNIGPGYIGSGTLLAGHYKNNSGAPVANTYTATVTATDYVSRLEFGAYRLPGYAGGDIILDNVTIMQEHEGKIYDVSTAGSAPGNIYRFVAPHDGYMEKKIRPVMEMIEDHSTYLTKHTYPITSSNPPPYTYDPNRIAHSATSGSIVYQFRNQNPTVDGIVKVDLSTTPATFYDTSNTNTYMHYDMRCVVAMPNGTGGDMLYIGNDGGISRGLYGGPYTNLNGKGLRTSWLFDMGSSIYTGEVGLAATDNSAFTSSAGSFGAWQHRYFGDGAQFKYGKRYETKNLRFYGWSSYSPFENLFTDTISSSGLPGTNSPSMVVNAPSLAKLVTTFKGEYFGTGNVGPTINHIYSTKVMSGTGSLIDPFMLSYEKITDVASYTGTIDSYEAVQAVAPDMYDVNFVAAYVNRAPWSNGKFAFCNNAAASSPVWSFENNYGSMSPNVPLQCMVADPRSSWPNKRLWAGAAGYGIAGEKRVFQTSNCGYGGGADWDDVSYGLPSGPINALAYDEQSRYLFAGTDQGIFAFNVEGGANGPLNPWVCYSLKLPNSFITAIDINRCTGKIYASTYGRGAYEANLPPQYNVGGAATTDYTDSCNFHTISSTTSWTGERFEFRSIYIPAGVTLTLNACTVNMAKDKYFIVAKGGQLIVNNSKLTNACGQIWGGIMAKGDPLLPQTPANQGWVVIQNNSVIEYARNAVSNCDVINDDPGFPWHSGGVVRAENSTFRNNLQSVTFYPYHNVTSSVTAPNYSAFSRCNFEWNIDNRAAKLGYTAGSHARLIDVEAVKFYGCNFLNRDTATAIKGKGTGIHIVNAGAHVLPTSILYLPHYSAPRFCGFENGIMAQGNGGSQLLAVRSAQFDSNSVGINISKHDNLSATGCSFKIGNGLPVQVVYGKPSSFIGCKQNIGILAAATPAFTIENNIFSGRVNASSLWYNLGAVVVNSSYNSKRVYGNRFDTLTFGVAAMGDNRPPTGGIGGLSVFCNHFQDNNTDLFIGRQNGILPDNQGITAGLPSVPFGVAGNKFYNSTTNIVNNGAPLYYTYSSVSSNEAPLTVTGSAPTIVSSIATPSGCTSSGVILSGTSPDGAMHGGFLTSPKTAYQSNVSAYQAAMGILAGRMDNGNRAELAAYIDTVSNGDSLYAVLQSVAPYLSNATLEQMIDRGVMSYGQEYEVLVANPDAVRKDGLYHDVVAYFEDAYANSSPPIPDYATMLASHIDDTTARTWLEDTVFSARVQADEQLNLIVAGLRAPVDTNLGVNDTTGSNICMDTTSMYYLQDSNARYLGFDSVDTWLQKMVSPFAVYDRIAFQYNRGNFAAAHTIFTGIAVGALTGLERETYDTFAHVWSVLKAAADSGRKYYWLTESERAMLYYDESKPLASSNAARELIKNVKTLTPPVYELDWNCGEAPRPGGTKRVKRFTIKSSASTKGWVKVYPNPSEGLVTFDYGKVNRSGGGDISMVVMNVLGEKVFEQTIKNDIGRLVWDSKKLPSGAYIFQFSDEGGVFGSGKVVLVK